MTHSAAVMRPRPGDLAFEFPDFNPRTLPVIPGHWVPDHHADEMVPSWIALGDPRAGTDVVVWIDYANLEQRLCGRQRYGVSEMVGNDYETIFTSDDWGAVLAFIESRRGQSSAPCPALHS